MQGAKEYANLFETGQYGRIYLVSGSHARGKTFRIFVLPEGCEAKPNGQHNAPLNGDAVEVYGVTCGNPGWTEAYGWLHKGKWQDDFAKLVEIRNAELSDQDARSQKSKEDAEAAKKRRDADLLAAY